MLLFLISLVAARFAGQTSLTCMSLGHVNYLPDFGLAAWGLWLATGIGEQLGWRGFALPRLQPAHSAMSSTLLLATGWAGWHVPRFFYVPSYTAVELRILPGFFLGVLADAIVLTWLYTAAAAACSRRYCGTRRSTSSPPRRTRAVCRVVGIDIS
jgi:CAAX protease family protein